MLSARLVCDLVGAGLLGGMLSASLLGGMLSASLVGGMISASLLASMFSARGGVFSSFTSMVSVPSSVSLFCISLLWFKAFLTTCTASTCLLRAVASLFKSCEACHCWLHVFLPLHVIDVTHRWTSQIEHQNTDVRF